MNDPVEFLELDDIVGPADALSDYLAPIRDIGLLGSAVARLHTTAFDEDVHPDIWTQAAALVHSIAERLGQLATRHLHSVLSPTPGRVFDSDHTSVLGHHDR